MWNPSLGRALLRCLSLIILYYHLIGPSKPIRDFGSPWGEIGILGFHSVWNWDFRNQVWNWDFGIPVLIKIVRCNPSEIGIWGFRPFCNWDSGISTLFKLGFWDSRTPSYRALLIFTLSSLSQHAKCTMSDVPNGSGQPWNGLWCHNPPLLHHWRNTDGFWRHTHFSWRHWRQQLDHDVSSALEVA